MDRSLPTCLCWRTASLRYISHIHIPPVRKAPMNAIIECSVDSFRKVSAFRTIRRMRFAFSLTVLMGSRERFSATAHQRNSLSCSLTPSIQRNCAAASRAARRWLTSFRATPFTSLVNGILSVLFMIVTILKFVATCYYNLRIDKILIAYIRIQD